MDPFKVLPSDVFDSILQHLSFGEIKEASLVSKNWYDTIGKSNERMKNVNLYFGDFGPDDIQEQRDCLLKSNRLYQNLFTINIHEDVHSKNPNSIRISRSILNKFSSSVACLHITNDIQRISNLPKLKELRLSCFYAITKNWPLYYGGLTSSISLEKLEIFCYDMSEQAVKVLKYNLKRMKNLKSLCVHDASILKDWNAKDYKFELKEFFWRGQRIPDDDRLLAFIGAFKSTLEVFEHKSDVFHKDLVFCLTNLPQLHTLIIHSFDDDCDDENDPYPVNNTIKTLAISMYKYSDEAISNLLLALPNLEIVKIHYLNNAVFKFARTCKSLKTVEYKCPSSPAFKFKKKFPNINLIHNEKMWDQYN